MSIRSQQKKITICQHMVQSYNFNFLSFFLAIDKIRFFYKYIIITSTDYFLLYHGEIYNMIYWLTMLIFSEVKQM